MDNKKELRKSLNSQLSTLNSQLFTFPNHSDSSAPLPYRQWQD